MVHVNAAVNTAAGWDRVVGQDRAIATLQQAVSGDRVGHAYLFFGPSGVGKRAAAIAFAEALLCERHSDPAADKPCGECNSCARTGRGLHPDLRVHLPFPGKEPPSDIVRRREMLFEDAYASVDYSVRPSLSDPSNTANKQTRYPIDYVHEALIRAQAFRPVEAAYKVTIITAAHLLGERGSNALLKSLEEPPPQTVNILLTDRPDLLLETVRSRCEQVRFVQIDAAQIADALVGRGVATERADVVSRMADGSLSRALELAGDEDLAARRELVVAYMRASYTRNAERITDISTTMTAAGREQLKQTQLTLLDWVRDLVLYGETGDRSRIVNSDQADVIAAFCEALPDADLAGMAALVEQALVLTERNANVKLLMAVLAQKLGRAMRGAPPGALFEPLAAPAVAGV